MAITDWKKGKTLIRFIVVIQTIAALLCLASLVLPFFKINPPNANPLLMSSIIFVGDAIIEWLETKKIGTFNIVMTLLFLVITVLEFV